MSSAQESFNALTTAQLGDVVTLPDGRRATIRAVARNLGIVVGSMAGFLLAGEIGPSCALLALPPNPSLPVGVYVPLPKVPTYAKDAVQVAEGVVSYWAPHVRGLSGAMGELSFKIATVRGQVEPMVLLWRGEELVVFVRSMGTDASSLHLEQLIRNSQATEVDVPLYTSRVTTPDRVPSPSEPAPLYAQPGRREGQ